MFSSILCGLWLSVATASDASDLAVFRGRVAIEQGEGGRAIRSAREALETDSRDPLAQELYADAMILAGEGGRALADLMQLERAPDPAELQALSDAVQNDDIAAAKVALKDLDERLPNQLSLRRVLWLTSPVSPGIARLQQRVLRQSHNLTPERDASWLYQARAIRQLGGQPVADLDDALVAAGEPRPPEPALRVHERSELARSLVNTPTLALPNQRADELFHLVRRLSDLSVESKQPGRAIEAWQLYRGRWERPMAAVHQGEVQLIMKRHPQALQTLIEAEILPTDPWARDAAVTDMLARARVWTAQLHVSSQALEANVRLPEALVAVSLAEQLRGAPVDDSLFKRLRKKMLVNYQTYAKEYGPAPAERALKRARTAATPDEVLRHSQASLFLYAYADAGAWQYDAAELLWLQSQAHTALEHPDTARSRLHLSLMLSPKATPERWMQMAALREQAEQWDAAFAAYATARERGADTGDALQRVYWGPTDPLAAAPSMVTPIPVAPEHTAGVKRTQVYVYATGRVARPGAQPKGNPVSEGQRMPDWSLTTSSGGVVDRARTRGRTVVMFFWISSCAPCLAALPQVASVAQELRKTGRDVVVVAVSMDEDDDRFEGVRRVGEKWGLLIRDPNFGFKMGLTDVPTWWIIDTNGMVRTHSTTWVNARHFERALRRAVVE